ncbi:alpha-E domain-containing protein [Devosia ginsengisoli]|uniref:alpha-E domain-containing protein n=1 Tax=Devosia ginsengisoli TaxID=400770 RepID=UPI0026EE7B97|nr:alpha-E domain-containing protein [Devosia ginsengisoli]MCR6672099.1 alpha-E domain-containing protein [Devosia ginsengisoli]
MLLGRAANGLYWMNRYIERAENMARLVDTGHRLALTQTGTATDEWMSVMTSAGVRQAFDARNRPYDAAAVVDFLLRDPDNPSSVMTCMETARINGRLVRTSLTREVWESVNEAWMALRRILGQKVDERELPWVLDAIKRETALIRGAFHGTMLRNEIFDFAKLGTLMERADSTARILDVKYWVLLPSVSWVGSTFDTHQWQTILRSVSAQRSFRWSYEGEYTPANVADYIILNRRMPRSLAYCHSGICDALGFLAEEYGTRHTSHQMAQNMLTKLRSATIADIFEEGLHEFLTEFLRSNAALADQIAVDYRFY